MITLMDKHAIIKLKLKGISNRKAAKILGIDRKTIGAYWNEYKSQINVLDSEGIDINEIQEKICSEPTYDSSGRKCRKYTDEMDKDLDEILEDEKEKCKVLGVNKQKLTLEQIYQLIKEKGHDISKSTIDVRVREKRNYVKECFIRQDYEYGDRLEYDFGEVKLVIDGVVDTYHIAVISSPGSNFRWAYLYKNQKKEVFMDSHVRFFEMIGGVYKEVVYDNMKNVVSRFIGKHKKELNKDLINLSLYYGFDINVTNCFSGNEKGHVEGSVKIIRNKVFATTYRFKTFEEAEQYLQTRLIDLNEESKIQDEIPCLMPYKPKLELADIRSLKVNKYSFIRVDNNFYSVPEYLVGRVVTAKVYYNRLIIFSNDNHVCEHKKIDGNNEISIDIKHYLKSLSKKPGAIKNSLALKSLPQLKSIFDNYYSKNPKEFIEIIKENTEKSIDELILLLDKYHETPNIINFDSARKDVSLNDITRKQTSSYNNICIKGAK